jgi:hypothetical protein
MSSNTEKSKNFLKVNSSTMRAYLKEFRGRESRRRKNISGWQQSVIRPRQTEDKRFHLRS